jgi:hypothetical protein
MSTPHRATEEQWEIVEICREEGHTPWPTATCLLELRSRVEVLERRCEVQLQQVGDLQDRHHRLAGNVRLLEREAITDWLNSEPSPDATDEELNLIFMQYRDLAAARRVLYDLGRQHGARAAATEADNATAATVAEIRSSLFKDAAQPAPSAQPEPPTLQEAQANKVHHEAELARLKCKAMQQPALDAPPPLRCPGAHTIAECGGPCEDDFRLCDCGLLQQLNPAPSVKDSLTDAPAGSLVERVMVLLGHHGDGTARAAIREVADWLRENDSEREMGGDAAATADLIEQEASR